MTLLGRRSNGCSSKYKIIDIHNSELTMGDLFEKYSRDNFIDRLEQKSYDLFESKEVSDIGSKFVVRENKSLDVLKADVLSDFTKLWDYRWMALYIYLEIKKDDFSKRKIKGDEVINLFRTNGNDNAFVVNLSYLDFKDIRAPSLFFVGVNLSFTEFLKCTLIGANMWNCKLNYSKIVFSNLSGSLIHNSQFTETDLSGSNLKNTHLNHVIVFDSNISSCDFSHTTWENSMILFSRMNSFNLLKAIMNSSIILSADSKFDFLVDENTVFKEVKTDNPDLVEYLSKHRVEQLPMLFENKEEMKNELVTKLRNEELVDKLLSMSKL